ncbi:zinc finger protein 318 [Salmo trutta]|uniref:Zinc finger protein 318 n=1 Tax=Salmo trutta TaxID=8032 RepID=A0A673XTF2_SALTR|nr:zinc finger protein 318-like [Salmo trutta]
MYRGRPPPRGGYPPPYEGRGPPSRGLTPGRPYPRPPFREERGRPRPPFEGYHDGPPPDSYRRSPPRRRYTSAGSGSRRGPGGEYWGSGPPQRERSPSPRGGIPTDHSLVITVGNELTGPPGVGLPSRDYPPYLPKRSSYDGPDDRGPRRQSPSRGRSRPRSRSPGFGGRSKSRPRSRSPGFGGRSKSRPRSRSPGFGGRSKSRPRSRSPGIGGRSKSRPRSRSPAMGRRSKSCVRSRSPAMGGRSKSRARSRSPEMGGRSKSRVRSRSPEMKGRSKSRARSRSPEMGGRSKSRARSKSPEMGRRSKSRGRSKSRPPSRSRSRSGSHGQSYGRARSMSRAKTAGSRRSRSVSTSSTSSSRSSRGGDNNLKKTSGFKELELARRRKEMEDMLNIPTKSILKRRVDSETDSPSYVQNSDSPRVDPTGEAEAERLLSAMKGMDPIMLATMLGELRDDPHMAQGRLDHSGIAGILDLLGGAPAPQEEKRKRVPDIDDEEKFLYGDEDDVERGRAPAEAPRQHSLSELYGDIMSEPARYGTSPRLEGHPGIVDPRSSHQQQMDMRYRHQSRSSAIPDHNIKVEEPNDYPPGTGPLEGKEKQDVEEYEKIQDLLKTIGLDLGVTEISKMAARTQERLHGKRPPPKTPSRRPGKRRDRRDSSGSSDRSRGRSCSGSSSSSRSDSHSPSRSSSRDNSRNRKKSPPSDRHSIHGKTRGGREVRTEDSSWGQKASQAPETTPVPPTHPSLSMPAYAQAQAHGLVPPNYPPPGYGQYGNWPYMPQQWPMYPPPSMGMPPQSPIEDFPNTPPFDRPYLKVIQPELHQGGDRKASSNMAPQDNGKDRRVLEERNNESQKQKVLEEREKLRRDREVRMKKKDYLMKELERLRKQQGELLRKKRREKDGHKDPLLSEISRLQEEVMTQIAELRKEHEVAEKKRSELDKVALILGLQPNDKPRREGRGSADLEQPTHPPHPEKEKKKERAHIREKSPVAHASAKAASSSSRASPEKPKKKAPASTQRPETPADLFEYYDAGNHWCKSCNVTCGSMFDFFTHLHSKSHRKTQDPYNRPWASSSSNNEKNKIHSSAEKMTKPAKGSEFLVPVRGYYCQLCEEFCGDAICAEDHATSQTHNEKYKKRMYEYPLYEQRRNLDRQAGLTLEVSDKKHSELKRKHEEEESKKSKEKEEGKPKRSKKDKEKEEEKSKHKREDEVERVKYSKNEEEERYLYRKREEEERYKYGKEGGERPKYSKKEEDERYKHGNEEERFNNRREEEEWFKNHREEEERLKNRREDEDRPRFSRVEERPKFSWRDNEQEEEEDRSRYGKWKEPNPKCSKKEEERYRSEREEGKPKNEKEERQSRKEKGGCQREEKSGSRKQSEPEKPSDPPKVFCGPNPALRAKLRKKSEETAKVEPKTPSAFGKFSWKKNLENELAKEAERVAVEFLKEDEEEVEEDDDPDAFSKSLAAAKSIAIKLSGKTVISPTSAWVPFNSGKIRPNLPAPSTVLRKPSGLGPWVYAKPAPLNTFLSIRPPGDSGVTPLPVIQNQPKNDPVLAADIISKAFCGEEVDLKKSADGNGKPGPTSTPDEKKASTAESFSQASTSTPSAVMPEFKTPLPPLTMMTMKFDVSAPGVPESEQNVPVMVTPPPFMQRPPSEVMNKSEKPKSNLAAAKAQDLFDIFYSSITTASTTSITSTATKAVIESKGETNDSKNSEALATTASQMEQTQPELPAFDNSNPIETETQESETESEFDPQATKAVVESKAAPNYSKNSEALEATAPKTEQTQPEFPALDNSNTVETDTQESIKMESGFDPQATKAVVESKAAPNDSNDSEALEATAPQTEQTQPELPALDNRNDVETDTQESMETESGFDPQATKAVVESKAALNDSNNSEALEATAPQTEQTQPELPALDNSNTIETNTPESMETESGSDPQPKEETPEDAPVQLDNPSDSLGISTETLDLPTEVLGLDLFDFNLE